MFYEKQTNKPWKLKWEKLSNLYNDDDDKKVRQIIMILFYILNYFRKNVVIYWEGVLKNLK
jgi:hypothetical protein